MGYHAEHLSIKRHNFSKKKFRHRSYYDKKYKRDRYKHIKKVYDPERDSDYSSGEPEFGTYHHKGIDYFNRHYWRRTFTIHYAIRFNFPKIIKLVQEQDETDEDFSKKLYKLNLSCKFHSNLTRYKVYRYRRKHLLRFFRYKLFAKKNIKKIPNIIPLIYYNAKFARSLHTAFKIKNYDLSRFIGKFFSVFIKNGNKQRAYNVIISALKHICLKYNLNILSVLFFFFATVNPSAYLRPYYVWRNKFFTGDIVTKINKRISLACYLIKAGIKNCENRTLFLKFVNEFDNFLLCDPKSKILEQRRIFIEKLRETTVKDRYDYTNVNTGAVKKRNNVF